MKPQRLAAFGAAVIITIGLTAAAATPALAHDELRESSLEVDSATGELTALTFVFSNDIMAVGTEILVTDETGKNVASAEPEVSGPNVRQPLDAPLQAGTYQAAWRVVSSDGHPIEGAFDISVAADGTAKVLESNEIEDAEKSHSEDDQGDTAESADDHGENHGEDGQHHAGTDHVTATAAPGIPAGGWIAIGVVLLAGIAVTAIVIARKGKQPATVETSHEADNTSHSTHESDSVN